MEGRGVKFLLAVVLMGPLLNAEDTIWKLAFGGSLVASGGASVYSTWTSTQFPPNVYETNPLLANPDGSFRTGRAVAVKGSIFAAQVIGEPLLLKFCKTKGEKRFAYGVSIGINAIMAGVFFSKGRHNVEVSKGVR